MRNVRRVFVVSIKFAVKNNRAYKVIEKTDFMQYKSAKSDESGFCGISGDINLVKWSGLQKNIINFVV